MQIPGNLEITHLIFLSWCCMHIEPEHGGGLSETRLESLTSRNQLEVVLPCHILLLGQLLDRDEPLPRSVGIDVLKARAGDDLIVGLVRH